MMECGPEWLDILILRETIFLDVYMEYLDV